MRRRQLLQVCGGSLALAGCTAPTNSVGGEWPMFRYDSLNTGHPSDAYGPKSTPDVDWSVRTSGAIWGSPAVSGGLVYIGNHDGLVYAFDAASGEEVWSYRTGSYVDSSPAVVDGVMYVGSWDNHVYAIDATDGEEMWSYDAGDFVRSSPTVADGVVYIGTHCQLTECTSYFPEREHESDGYLVALDATSGDRLWKHEVGREVVSTPAVDAQRVYVGTSAGFVLAVDRETGKEVWTVPTDGIVYGAPTVADGRVYYAPMTNSVHAVDANSGDPIWDATLETRMTGSSPAIDDARVYIGSGGRLYAIDRADGTLDWSITLSGEILGSSPAVVDGLVYVGTHNIRDIADDPGVFAVTSDGELQWTFRESEVDLIAGDGFGSSPAVVDGTLFIGTESNRITALR